MTDGTWALVNERVPSVRSQATMWNVYSRQHPPLCTSCKLISSEVVQTANIHTYITHIPIYATDVSSNTAVYA